MDIFSDIHNPEDWDLISHSDGEYFEISSSSDSSDDDLPDIKRISLNSDSSDSDETFIPDIKMFHFSSLDTLQAQIEKVKTQLSRLDPTQLTMKRRLTEKLEGLEKPLPSTRNKNVFKNEEFIQKEFDSIFQPLKIKEDIYDSGMEEINTLKKEIGKIESSIQHTRNEMIQLSSKLQYLLAEYDDHNSKLAKLLLKEVSEEEMPMKSKDVDLVNILGIDDRMVISINIKLPKIKEYTLDAQIDSGAMSSCCKYGAIPAYYWQPTKIAFRAC